MDFVCIDDVSVRVFLYVCGCEIGLEYIRRTQFGFGQEKTGRKCLFKILWRIRTDPYTNGKRRWENRRQWRPAACSNTKIGMA